MIKLSKGEEPDILKEKADAWTEEYLEALRVGNVTDTIKYRYRDKDIKESLISETNGKCAYCESKIEHVSPGDVEHILPKKLFPERYVEWNNLTYSCEICNRSGKKDYHSENLPIINPYIDDPDEHFVDVGPIIHPIDGDQRAQLTIELIGLNRAALVERRRDRLRYLEPLIKLHDLATDPEDRAKWKRQLMLECGKEKEYTSTTISYLRAIGIEA